jgi:hypothetical protein
VEAHSLQPHPRSIPRYRVSCDSHSETVTLLLFGGPPPSLGNRFGLWRGQLLSHFGCCSLRTFATETAGKLASIICVDLGVVLRPRNGYVREAVVDQQLAFLGVHVDQHSIRGLPLAAVAGHCATGGRTDLGLQNFCPSPIDKPIPNQSILPLTARTSTLQRLHVTHSKDETAPASESMTNLSTLSKLFI